MRGPGAEDKLLQTAKQGSLGELNDQSRRVRANADPDPEATRRRMFAQRSLRSYRDAEGAFHLHFTHTTDTGARVMGALRPFIDQAFDKAKAKGRFESPEAYGADGLVEALCRTAERPSGGGHPKYIVRIDRDALMRGAAVGDEVCEVVGVGPVSVTALKDLALVDDPFWTAIVTTGHEVLSVAHLGRRPNAFQLTALQWRYPTCAVIGCNQWVQLEWDHTEEFCHTQHTTMGELDGLCRHHHRLKSTKGWMLVEGRAPKRLFVPPGDPRHPRYAKQRSGQGPPPEGDSG